MRATNVIAAGTWDTTQACDQFCADYEGRYRRRMVLSLQSGRELLLDLPQAHHLREGDGLCCEDGRLILVQAAPEEVVEITAPHTIDVMRLAWHLGNRHCPTMIGADCLLIRRDPVLEEMLKGLGGHLQVKKAGFDPERGAYHEAHRDHSSSQVHHH